MVSAIIKSGTFLLLSSLFLLLFNSHSVVAQEDDNALQFSGFARVVLGYFDDSNATYLGYDNSVSINQQSLIGLQADYQITNKLSATAQFVGHTSDDRDSGVEWLYLTYQPNRSSQIKLGKQRTPFFNYSDSIDVGFAYPWITLPQEVYSSVFFSTFDGILANYEWSVDRFVFGIEGYWGNFNDDISKGEITLEANVNDLRGVIAKLSFDNWSLRTAYHTADATFELDELTQLSMALQQFGFIQSANSLNSDGSAEFYQLAASYENLDYFFRSELTKTLTEASTIPDIDSYYVAAGYHYYPFSSYLSFAKSKSTYVSPVNEIPIGLSPQLDGLAYAYRSASQFPFDSTSSITLGTRWDWKSNIALKAEITWTETLVSKRAIFAPLNGAKFNTKTPLYQLALEWVF